MPSALPLNLASFRHRLVETASLVVDFADKRHAVMGVDVHEVQAAEEGRLTDPPAHGEGSERGQRQEWDYPQEKSEQPRGGQGWPRHRGPERLLRILLHDHIRIVIAARAIRPSSIVPWAVSAPSDVLVVDHGAARVLGVIVVENTCTAGRRLPTVEAILDFDHLLWRTLRPIIIDLLAIEALDALCALLPLCIAPLVGFHDGLRLVLIARLGGRGVALVPAVVFIDDQVLIRKEWLESVGNFNFARLAIAVPTLVEIVVGAPIAALVGNICATSVYLAIVVCELQDTLRLNEPFAFANTLLLRLLRHAGMFLEGRHREVVHCDRVATLRWMILLTETLTVGTRAVHPQHLMRVPITHHRCHAVAQGNRQLIHAFIVVHLHVQLAIMSALRQLDFEGCQNTFVIVNREGCCDMERLLGVDATGTGPIFVRGEVSGAIPAIAAAQSCSHASVVVLGVQCRMPRVHVGLLDVDLRTRNAAHAVGIAVEVIAIRLLVILPHRHQVERAVASAIRCREVDIVVQRLPQELESCVLFVVVRPRCARVCKVCTASHGGGQVSAVDLDVLRVAESPTCRDQLDSTAVDTIDVQRPWARGLHRWTCRRLLEVFRVLMAAATFGPACRHVVRMGHVFDGEVGHRCNSRATRRLVGVAWSPLVIWASTVKPKHLVRCPITHHWGHAMAQRLAEICQTSIFRQPELQVARLAGLREVQFQRCQNSFAAGWKRHSNLEGQLRVNARATRTVLLDRPIARPSPAIATAQAAAHA
mmetsp:Transcript_18562/g.51775  ORF Transcript_18562/g.51775 Transcript_18562/m.51775 type:complete len:761 (-) Transcript_18562:593-2875(-)